MDIRNKCRSVLLQLTKLFFERRYSGIGLVESAFVGLYSLLCLAEEHCHFVCLLLCLLEPFIFFLELLIQRVKIGLDVLIGLAELLFFFCFSCLQRDL